VRPSSYRFFAFLALAVRIARCAARRFVAGCGDVASPLAVRVRFTVAAAMRSAVSWSGRARRQMTAGRVRAR
jgi:hypothetical protein